MGRYYEHVSYYRPPNLLLSIQLYLLFKIAKVFIAIILPNYKI